MAGSPSIDQIVAQIRTAIFGKDVRENIALGIEKCYEESSINIAYRTVKLQREIKELLFNHAEVLSTGWEQGSINSQGAEISTDTRIRFVGKLKIKQDCTIFAMAENGYEVGFNLYNGSQVFKNARDWAEYDSVKYGSGEDEAVYFRLVARHVDNSSISVSESNNIVFVSIPNTDYVTFINNIVETQNNVVSSVALANNGYIDSDGTTHAQTYEIEKYSEKIPISKGSYIYQYDVDFPSGKTPWIRLSFYNSNNGFVSDKTYTSNKKQNTVEFDIISENIAYMTMSCRTFGVKCSVSLSGGFVNLLNNSIHDIDNAQKVLFSSVSLSNDGYIDSDGTPHAQTYEIEKYSEKIPVSKGSYIYQYDVDFPSGKTPWIRLSFYNSNNSFISDKTHVSSKKQNTVEFDITSDSVAYMAISCRTFGAEYHVGISDRVINILNDKIQSYTQNNNFNKSNSTIFVSREGKFSNTIENSADGIRAAKFNGYDYIRMDVQFSSDGIPVCFHDDIVGSVLPVYDSHGERITDGGKISTYPYSYLALYHFGSTTNPIVTLENCVALCKKYGLGLVLEIKEATVPTRQNLSDAYDIVAKAGMVSSTEWDVYTAQTAGYIQDIDDSVDIGYISEDITTATIDAAAALKTEKNKVYFCAYASRFSSFTDALHVYGARHGVLFKMGSAYSVQEINNYRKFEKIEVANVINPAKEFAMYS